MSNELTTLSTLAVEIDALNEQANIYANQALVYAAKCGQKLLLAKAQCNHGQFKSWLDENCRTSYTNAKNYMQLASKMPELLKGQTSDLLKLSQAISLLNAPEEVKTEVLERIENGDDVSTREIQRLKKEATEAQAKLDQANKRQMELVQKVDAKQEEIATLKNKNWKLENQQQQIIEAKLLKTGNFLIRLLYVQPNKPLQAANNSG